MSDNIQEVDPRYVIDLSEEQLMQISPEFLKKLREEMPVAYLDCMSVWYITKAEDVLRTMRDQKLFRIFIPEVTTLPVLGPIYNQGDITPDQYRRIRQGSDTALNPKAMRVAVPEIIIPCIEAQLDKMVPGQSIDLLDDFFGLINYDVMKQILGVPHIDNVTLARWNLGLHDCLENLTGDPVREAKAWELGREIDEFFRPIVFGKEAEPDHSLISHMLAMAEGETAEERRAFIMGHVKVILLAGVQEGAHAAVNAIIGMYSNPSSLEKFKSDPEKYADLAAEESVRFLPPVASTHRRVVEDVEISGVKVPAGSDLLISMASASRDPTIWGADADVFVIDRFERDRSERGAQLGFGHMPRFCQGAPFVRNFLHEGLIRLFTRFPNLRPDPAHEWKVPFGLLSNYCHMQCILE